MALLNRLIQLNIHTISSQALRSPEPTYYRLYMRVLYIKLRDVVILHNLQNEIGIRGVMQTYANKCYIPRVCGWEIHFRGGSLLY